MSTEYKPDGRCGTCRHVVGTMTGDGFHEPREWDAECGVEDQLIQVANLMKQIGTDMGNNEVYGAHPEDGWGDTKPCPLFLPWETCKEHGLPMNPGADFGCPTCDQEGYAAMAADMAEDERLAKEEGFHR